MRWADGQVAKRCVQIIAWQRWREGQYEPVENINHHDHYEVWEVKIELLVRDGSKRTKYVSVVSRRAKRRAKPSVSMELHTNGRIHRQFGLQRQVPQSKVHGYVLSARSRRLGYLPVQQANKVGQRMSEVSSAGCTKHVWPQHVHKAYLMCACHCKGVQDTKAHD